MSDSHWSEFVEKHNLGRRVVTLPAESDLSGSGGAFRILADYEVHEAQQSQVFAIVAPDGFIPVELCEAGGDYYYISTQDPSSGPLYRVLHQLVAADPYDASEAIEVVLADYEFVLEYLST